MSSAPGYLKTLVVAVFVFAQLPYSSAQTYKVNGGAEQGTPQKAQKQQKKKSQPAASSGEKSLGWGSNIQTARLGRAAEEALKNGQYSAATELAQRATQAAPNDPQLWFLLGYCARLAGKTQLSLDSFNHGLRIEPASLDGKAGLAQTLARMGRNGDAEKLLNEVLAADPKRTSDAAVLGELYLREGQNENAISVLQKAEQYKPEARAELLIALGYMHMRQYDQANRYLEVAKKRAPNNIEVLRSLGGYYRATANYPAAINILKPIANKSPDIKADLAYTYQLSGKRDEAAKLYSEAANSAPKKLELQLSAAQAEVNIGNIEQADPFLRRADALDAQNYRLHAVRGEIARLQDNNEDAIREYTAAIGHLPQSPPEGPLYPIQLHMNLMELYRGQGNDAESHKELEIAQSQISGLDDRGPTRTTFLRLRSLIESNTGNTKAADADLKEALTINPQDPDTLQLMGDLLVKTGHPDDGIAEYKKILAFDPNNRSALTALGYVSRTVGHNQEAEKYFLKLEAAYPKLYLPYLALGDMYASRKEFAKADASYRKANQLSPKNSLAVAGGMNAAIEAHQYPLAGEWLAKATTPEMKQNPFILREEERYLSFTGKNEESAAVGREALKKLPHDRDVIVYLGYDLLRMEKYDELLQLTQQYDSVLPKEPTIPLLAGYVHKHNNDLAAAEKDFTEALQRDPNVPTAYVNRGFVYNDTHRAAAAQKDFESALKIDPKDGEAHLGLAYATLEQHKPRKALKEVQLAEAAMGDSEAVHLIRATAYGEQGNGVKAASEYRTAIRMSPKEPGLHLALGQTLDGLHHYSEAITELKAAQALAPDDSQAPAQLARVYAQLKDKQQTLQYIAESDKHFATTDSRKQSDVLITGGEALQLIGETDAAMDRFSRALTAPDADRFSVRLAVARLMSSQGQYDGARRQIALAFMESRSGQTLPPTGDQLLQAADVFLGMHDFQLAQTYFERAITEGASETDARAGLANSYLAVGDTARAEGEIAAIANSADAEPTYQYLIAKGNVFRQAHQNEQAQTAFAQAAQAAGEDETADQALLQVGAIEGMKVHRDVTVLSNFSVEPIFEDTTVYPLDARLDALKPLPGRQALLPPPRSSIQTQWTGAYHLTLSDLLHVNGMPAATGFFQVRNARGEISVPSINQIVNRDTTDYSFNFGLNPIVHLGSNVFTFNTGVQETLRRDALQPASLNQNLFRQFVYMQTSSFFNLISVSGYALRETGPFTLSDQHSRDLTGSLNFRVGHPWAKTAFVTGWAARDLQFHPVQREFYFTSAYAGIERQIGRDIKFRVQAEDVRAWRVELNHFAIAQALRPAGTFDWRVTRNWSVEASAAYSRNMAWHVYDDIEGGFAVSYAMPIRRTYKDEGADPVEYQYPIRFSAGMQQETFYNFTQGHNQAFRPYVSITIF
ncbi:MAG TPA: tetratricopeptide repeat protein [Terriglobales bacterium]|nr:tetratricopeptide repeat protein [Terriglobales bacterium]